MSATMNNLKIKEIFFSIQGESTNSGLPTVFIRLTGCPLRCNYCDTAYAFHGGDNLSITEIITKVKTFPTENICITGGEPLAQKNCHKLIEDLIALGYYVSLETSGAIDISKLDPKTIIVMDIKTPDSGEQHKNLWSNIKFLKPIDQIKFVICSKHDYEWTKQVLTEHPEITNIECLLSPCQGRISAKELAEWILQDGLKVRMQIQMHKVIWGDEPGR